MQEFLFETRERGIAAMLMLAAVAVLGLGVLAWVVGLVQRARRGTGELVGALLQND